MANPEIWTAFELDVNNSADLMEECLLELEDAEPGQVAPLLDRLYRALHTFKGVARMMGLDHIERVSHTAEDLVSLSRDSGRIPEGECFDVLFASLAYLRSAGQLAAQTQSNTGQGASAELLERIERCRQTAFGTASVVEDAPSAPETGFVFFDDEADETEPTSKPLEGLAESKDSLAAGASSNSSRRSLPPRAAEPVAGGEYLRIHSSKVEEILNFAAELGLATHAVTERPEVLAVESERLTDATQLLERLVRDFREAAASLALVPVRPVFSRMKLVLREAARSSGKNIRLITKGDEVEVDKTLVDRLADPLVHILRNAADHGMESESVRRETGKPETGTVVLQATQQGGEIVVSVRDDGKGLDRERIVARAVERGLIGSGKTLQDEEVWQLIFRPGFSTADQVSELSGRGVGMDVVMNTVKELHGYVEVKSESGQGTTVLLHFPLTLSFLNGLIVRSGKYLFALPLDVVQKVAPVANTQPIEPESNGLLYAEVDGEVYSLCLLSEMYGARRDPRVGVDIGKVLVIVGSSRGSFVIPVEEVIGSHQVTMKPLKGVFSNIRGASAYGVLGTGEVAVTLDCEALHASLG